VQAVAVAFLWSIVDPSHEHRTAEIVREEMPGVDVVCSSDILPEIREWERTSSTVLSAYIAPIIGDYLRAFESEMQSGGLPHRPLIMQVNGGCAGVPELLARPVNAVASGPAAGPAAGAHYAATTKSPERLIVVDKPSGVAVHGGSGISHGVVELLRHARPELRDLSLVHRLDRETSGCLVLAKRRSALRELHARFREGQVEKNYLALVVGDWQLGEQIIDAPLLVEHRRGGERHVVVSQGGKPAQTRVQLSRTFGKYSLLQCEPMTGRTHQIRVHLASLEFPILGDDRYGDEAVNREAKKLGLHRLFLHAQSIAFADDSGNEAHFTAPLADDLERFLHVLQSTRKSRSKKSHK